MTTVAYLAIQFPSAVEPYVVEEIRELRRRGVRVVSCSVRQAGAELDDELKELSAETLCLQPLRLRAGMRATWLCLRRLRALRDLLARVVGQGNESMWQRGRALAHTWLGAYLAVMLEEQGVEHIHVHHGYFASWIAMVAARLKKVGFSMTLHGSDLLLHGAYLDTKLQECMLCATISEFNRKYILQRYRVREEKVVVCRMGVNPVARVARGAERELGGMVILAVGRLHEVKDHAFLVRACRQLKERGLAFLCLIAGEGRERQTLERMIHDLDLHGEVKLLGHVSRRKLDAYYAAADLVALTSRSEGIPLVLMEAMAHCRTVLAPAITGIPELVKDGRTGFLYRPGSQEDFVGQVEMICRSRSGLDRMRAAARQHVLEHFNREKNLGDFCERLLAQVNRAAERDQDEDLILQQI